MQKTKAQKHILFLKKSLRYREILRVTNFISSPYSVLQVMLILYNL